MLMKADAECLKIHAGEKVAVEQVRLGKDRGLMDVFVFVKKGLAAKEYPIPEEPAQLNQIGCMYRPRVQGVRVGQKFNIVNSDPTTHNVRGLAKKNRPFNFGQIGPGTRGRVFDKPEHPVKIKCDIHPWMAGFIFIMDHPYFAVTDADGKFSIEGLPTGKYTIEAWHELFGKQTLEVEVSDSGSAEGNFTFEPKKK